MDVFIITGKEKKTYQDWNSTLVHSNLWSLCLKPDFPGKNVLNSEFGVVMITVCGAMYPKTTWENWYKSSRGRCSMLSTTKEGRVFTQEKKAVRLCKQTITQIGRSQWPIFFFFKLQLNTGHQVESFEASIFLCDRSLEELHTQLMMSWLQIISRYRSQSMPVGGHRWHQKNWFKFECKCLYWQHVTCDTVSAITKRYSKVESA